ncbi:zinc-finger homeodomain protein 5-like [Salvia miltiorrhiza]|uniref:zinc-finger homeodomain protein 5-like n=1 Tax=Salvia miltiorrhiza TaxID=226208 RepID=UPI0025AD4387|nr:zinc-finger homeodomain protein 5-like [Salvia miltiorrhiza]
MMRISYRECLKNHAATIGGNVTDGCGEFMPAGQDGTLQALTCAACTCHRNFHRAASIVRMPDLAFHLNAVAPPPPQKRFRTKFTAAQKEKMVDFADKVGWRIPREDDAELQRFCSEAGVKRQVFKVWMHNNKSISSHKTSTHQTHVN